MEILVIMEGIVSRVDHSDLSPACTTVRSWCRSFLVNENIHGMLSASLESAVADRSRILLTYASILFPSAIEGQVEMVRVA
jgi:hypothetical protein